MTVHAFKQQPTGEIALELQGANMEDLFVEAVRAVSELVGEATGDPVSPWVHEIVDSVNETDLLVVWINELLERIEVDKLLYSEVEIDELTDKKLGARMRGKPVARLRTPVVAAHTHGSHIVKTESGISATITLEIQH